MTSNLTPRDVSIAIAMAFTVTSHTHRPPIRHLRSPQVRVKGLGSKRYTGPLRGGMDLRILTEPM
jgi:hypothetical protein